MGYEHDGSIRISKKATSFIKKYIEQGNDVYTEGVEFFNFDRFQEETKGLSEHTRNYWSGLRECTYWEKNAIGYLSFSFYGTFIPFPVDIASATSRMFPNEEIAAEYSVEDDGGYLYVYKNGKCIFEDSYDYYDNQSRQEINKVQNPTSISFENYYQREKEPQLTEEQIKEREERWKKEAKIREEECWFETNKNKLPKNEDGTFIITENMPNGAKNKALMINEIIVAKANEPKYEDVVKELGRDYITTEETMKAIMWLDHHKHLTDGYFYTIAAKEMPILVKAYILFRRKKDKESEEFWDTLMSQETEEYEEYEEDEDY